MASSSSSFASSCIRDSGERDHSPYHINIFLSEKIYNPGEAIHGEVIFCLDKKLSCDLISIQLFGSVRIFWIEKEVSNNNFRPTAYEQKRVLVDETKVLWSGERENRRKPIKATLDDIVRLSSSTTICARNLGKAGDFQGLEVGDHKFEFTFQLPKQGLYTSFDLKDCGGRIRYWMNVQCFSYDRLVVKKKLVFPVVCSTDPAHCLKMFTGCNVKKRTELNKDRYLDVELSISKRSLVPGEKLPVQIYIDNRSGKSVKYAHLSIQQHVFGIATYPITFGKDWFQDTLGVGMDVDKIPTGSIHKYAPKFNVPALVPNFEIDGCITLKYALKLDIGFNRVTTMNSAKHVVCTLTIPLFIGTNSITYADLAEKPKFLEVMELPPPSYSDIPPPPYDEYISELHINNGAESPCSAVSRTVSSAPPASLSSLDVPTAEDEWYFENDKKNV